MPGIHGTSTTMTPDRFFNDMQQLASQSPRDAADVANTWRTRYLNAAEDGVMTGMQKGWTVATGFGTGVVYGAVGGHFKAEDDDIWEDWKLEGHQAAGLTNWTDGSPYVEGHKFDKERYPSMKPGTLWGVPYSFLLTLGTTIAALFRAGGGANYLFEASASAGIVYWGAQLGDMLAYDWNMNRIKKAEQAALGQQAP